MNSKYVRLVHMFYVRMLTVRCSHLSAHAFSTVSTFY